MLFSKYNLFLPPEHLTQTKAYLWSKREAKEYFKWFLSIKDDRLNQFFKYLGREDADKGDLLVIAREVENRINSFFLRERVNGERLDLTNEGYAIAVDFGLYLSRSLLQSHDNLYWDFVKKPKNDLNYHLPVIFGYSKPVEYFDSLGVSVTTWLAIINEEEKLEFFKTIFESALLES